MIKIKLAILFLALNALTTKVAAQANPSIGILPLNPGGLVALGATMDVKVTVNNTLAGTIVAAKLRPVITIPNIATILPDAQQTGLPPGWVIVSNLNGQIRVCNSADPIGGNQQRDIIIKVQGSTIGGPTQCQVQLNYGGATCAVSGPQPNGNITVDDFATSSITVVAGCSLSVNATAGTILCNAAATTITAAVTAASGPVEYSITGAAAFQASNIFNNIVAGTYTVTAREVNNPTTCVASTVVIVTEPAAIPLPSVNIIQPTCSVPNGIVTITSATAGLSFSIDGGAFSAYPSGGYSLPPGSHTITAKNNNDCSSPTTTIIINAQPLTPSAPMIGTVTQPDCTISTGSIVLNGLPAGTWIIEPGTIAGNTATTIVDNLAAGSYSFTVTNSAGCSSLPSANVDIIAVVGAPEAPLITITQPSCTMATGTIIITSPLTGLTFSLDGAAFGAYPTGGYTGISAGTHTLIAQNISGCSSPVTNIFINEQPASPPAPVVNVEHPNCTVSTGIITVTSTTTGLTFSIDGGSFAPYPVAGYIVAAGIHSIAVQNGSGCIPNITGNIIVNAQPSTPSLSAVFTEITCFNGSSMITATATGGVLPYGYSINGASFQSLNTFTVNAGSYTISVKDANGCIGNSNIIITQPTAITAVVSATPIPCNGGNATLTVSATGGLGAYEYSLNNGPYQTGSSFNVVAGTYAATVRLINNTACSTSVNTIINVTQPAILKASAKANAIEYCGGSTIANVIATGGTLPYTGVGNFVKGPGNWTFEILDSNGCSTSAALYIFPPGCVELKVFPNPAQNLITVNHSAALPGSAIQIYAVNGGLMLHKSVAQSAFISVMDVSTLASGTYLLVFTNGKERKEGKFVKTNK